MKPPTAILLFLGFVVVLGCQAVEDGANVASKQSPGFFDTCKDEPALKADVLQRIPVGTPIDSARTIMEENGFSCSFPDDDGPQMICIGGRKTYGVKVEIKYDSQRKVTAIDLLKF